MTHVLVFRQTSVVIITDVSCGIIALMIRTFIESGGTMTKI